MNQNAGQDHAGRGASVVFMMIAMLTLPAILALRTVEAPGTLTMTSENPTPLGYTWSLSLFIIPLLTIAWWFLRHPEKAFQRKAYWTTVGILVPIGFLLDLLLGPTFFTFEDTGAVLGIWVPALGGAVPIEEFGFYLTGFMFVLLFYIWNDEYWHAAYNVPDYREASARVERIVEFHAGSLIIGVVLLGTAFFYRFAFVEETSGFPGYFTFLVLGAILPAIGFFSTARPFINWRAFSTTFFIVVLVSLVWEATLAVPYSWWGFNSEWMIGIFIGAWFGLPIEEPCLWFAVSFTTIIVYEVIKIWQASGRGFLEAMLGTRIVE